MVCSASCHCNAEDVLGQCIALVFEVLFVSVDLYRLLMVEFLIDLVQQYFFGLFGRESGDLLKSLRLPDSQFIRLADLLLQLLASFLQPCGLRLVL